MKITKLNEQFEPIEETFDNSKFDISTQLTALGKHIDSELNKQGVKAHVEFDENGVTWVSAEGDVDIEKLVSDAAEKWHCSVDPKMTKEKDGAYGFMFLMKQTKQLKAESFDEEGNREYCDNCNTPLNDQGTCPKCDDGEEDLDRDLTEGNNVSSQLTPALDSFLQDIAQIHGTISYGDIMDHEYTEEDIKKLLSLRKQWEEEAQYEGEETDAILGNIADEVASIVKNNLEEDVLTEGPLKKLLTYKRDPLQRVRDSKDKAQTAHNKEADKIRNKTGAKVVAKDFKTDRKDCKFIVTTEGPYKGKVFTQDEWRKANFGDQEDKIRYDAIVVDKYDFFVRRGAEDLLGKRERYKKNINDKVTPIYSYDQTDVRDAANEDPVASSGADRPAEDSHDDVRPDEGGGRPADSDTGTDRDPSEEPPVKPRSTRRTFDASVLSKNTVAGLAYLVNNNGLKVFTSEGTPVTADDITAQADNPQALAAFKVDVRGKKKSFGQWFTSARAAALIEELTDEDVQALEEAMLTEAPVSVQYDEDDLMDPSVAPSLKDKFRAAAEKEREEQEAAEKAQRRAELMQQHKGLLDAVDASLKTSETPSDTLQVLFDALVPPEGKSETVAGELTRAMMRILYRDYNDGDKFYEGYGLETCGGSAEYLSDMIPEVGKHVELMLDAAFKYENDDAYTKAIEAMCQMVIDHIINNPELLADINEEDSRDYEASYIEENQPRYEFEWYASDDVVRLVEESIIDAWDLNKYVENQIEYESVFKGAEVDRPWSHDSTNGTISNLTKDGYERCEEMFRNNDAFWEELFNDYKDELPAEEDEDEDDEEDFEESVETSHESSEVDFDDVDDEDSWFDYQN